jgi:hypothetical protein
MANTEWSSEEGWPSVTEFMSDMQELRKQLFPPNVIAQVANIDIDASYKCRNKRLMITQPHFWLFSDCEYTISHFDKVGDDWFAVMVCQYNGYVIVRTNITHFHITWEKADDTRTETT